jgi:hypothetical protein
VGFVGRAVIRQDPLDGDSAGGEPGHGPTQHGCLGFIAVDLGVGDPGVVVDDRVHVRRPDPGVTVRAARFVGPSRLGMVGLFRPVGAVAAGGE